jgi:hypothetical protein
MPRDATRAPVLSGAPVAYLHYRLSIAFLRNFVDFS